MDITQKVTKHNLFSIVPKCKKWKNGFYVTGRWIILKGQQTFLTKNQFRAKPDLVH